MGPRDRCSCWLGLPWFPWRPWEPPGLGVGSGHAGRIPPGEAFTGGAEACLCGYLLTLLSREPVHGSSGRLERRGAVHLVPRRGCSSSRSPGPGLGQGKLSVKSLCSWGGVLLGPPLPCSLQEPKERVSLISCSSSVPRAREHHVGSSGYTQAPLAAPGSNALLYLMCW